MSLDVAGHCPEIWEEIVTRYHGNGKQEPNIPVIVVSLAFQFANPAIAFLTFDDEHHRFAILNMAVFQPDGTETDKQGSIGVDHLGYSYASLRDLLENYAVLKEKGVTPYWCIHHGITVALYYADPDGNQMEFQVDCLDSGEEASAFMESTFETNPIGVEFDPADWLVRLRTGTPESELLVRKTHEPISPIRGVIAQYMQA